MARLPYDFVGVTTLSLVGHQIFIFFLVFILNFDSILVREYVLLLK
jgi:hypothetical protein